MKVVINNKCGGFRLSQECMKECIHRGMTSMLAEEYYESPETNPADFYIEKDENIEIIPTSGKEERAFRTNLILINVIEEFGTDFCGGYHSEIKIVEIPFDTVDGWQIKEGDTGQEWIAEDHRTWY